MLCMSSSSPSFCSILYLFCIYHFAVILEDYFWFEYFALSKTEMLTGY